MKHPTPEEALVRLQEKYPGLNWRLYRSDNPNENEAYGLLSKFANHKIWINVFTTGCTATIVTDQQPVSKSPDEQGRSFDEVLACIESDLTSLISLTETTNEQIS